MSHLSSSKKTPMSNGQGRANAAARLAALPLVASVRAKLSVVYVGAKCSHPGLGSVCERLESGVTAVLSPVMGKLEPQISIANEAACRSLDWLEAAFPVLHAPTEQLVATAKKKMAEIQAASADCVRVGVAWLMVRLQGAQDRGQPLVDRAIAATAVGVETALSTSEALVDRMLPPAEGDKGKNEMNQHSEEALQRSHLERLFALATKLYRRTLSMNSRFTLIQAFLKLPQNLQYQLASAITFLSRTYSCPANNCQRFREPIRLRAPEIHYMDSSKITPPTCRLRKPMFENECSVKGCVDR